MGCCQSEEPQIELAAVLGELAGAGTGQGSARCGADRRAIPQGRPVKTVRRTPLIERTRELYRAGGMPRGSSTGWTELDEFYTVQPGQWTVVTGIPGSGKSEWLDALLVNLAESDDWRFALYSPENYPVETHLVKLAEKRTRKPFGPGPTERMSEDELAEACEWITARFMWLEPDLKTPEELITTAIEDVHMFSKKFGVVLDPWNTLEHNRGGMSETDYVSFILTEVTKLARSWKAHIWLVVHPAKIQRNKDGTRPVPTPYDISGSAHWYNKADNIVCVHRNQADRDSQDVEIHVQKVRFKHVGRVGLSTLKYDRIVGRYFEAPTMFRSERYADPERRSA